MHDSNGTAAHGPVKVSRFLPSVWWLVVPRAVLCLLPDRRKELVGFTDGARESAQDWRDLLLDLKRRGLDVTPPLTIADGALGFWKAAGEVWPKTREQRCWVHKTANVLAKLPKSQQPKA